MTVSYATCVSAKSRLRTVSTACRVTDGSHSIVLSGLAYLRLVLGLRRPRRGRTTCVDARRRRGPYRRLRYQANQQTVQNVSARAIRITVTTSDGR